LGKVDAELRESCHDELAARPEFVEDPVREVRLPKEREEDVLCPDFRGPEAGSDAFGQPRQSICRWV
jgi:hypothetical protein